MQKRIYQFEILRGVSNAVYEANDTARGTSVTLYEWTPDARALEDCLKVLNGLGKSDQYEVFSSGASLYLAAATERAGEAGLKRLREAGLFKGIFVGAASAAPPPPPPPIPSSVQVGQTKIDQAESTRNWMILALLAALGMALFLFFLLSLVR